MDLNTDSSVINQKRPRHYAADISKLKTRVERQEALKKVPKHLQELTKTFVEIDFSRRDK